MPFELSCKQCGQLLYEAKEITHYEQWYEPVYSRLRGQCSKCGHKLPEPWKYGNELLVNVLFMRKGKWVKVEAPY